MTLSASGALRPALGWALAGWLAATTGCAHVTTHRSETVESRRVSWGTTQRDPDRDRVVVDHVLDHGTLEVRLTRAFDCSTPVFEHQVVRQRNTRTLDEMIYVEEAAAVIGFVGSMATMFRPSSTCKEADPACSMSPAALVFIPVGLAGEIATGVDWLRAIDTEATVRRTAQIDDEHIACGSRPVRGRMVLRLPDRTELEQEADTEGAARFELTPELRDRFGQDFAVGVVVDGATVGRFNVRLDDM